MAIKFKTQYDAIVVSDMSSINYKDEVVYKFDKNKKGLVATGELRDIQEELNSTIGNSLADMFEKFNVNKDRSMDFDLDSEPLDYSDFPDDLVGLEQMARDVKKRLKVLKEVKKTLKEDDNNVPQSKEIEQPPQSKPIQEYGEKDPS
ncbi:MAG: hypothetical protein [Microvirus sp.]|nr:MAG: hypothetical protein [Microvirus sp.]